MLNTVKATLVKKITDSGIDFIKDEIPLGKVYEVLPESISEGINLDSRTGECSTLTIILASNDDGTFGWLPLELLKLEQN